MMTCYLFADVGVTVHTKEDLRTQREICFHTKNESFCCSFVGDGGVEYTDWFE